MLYTVAFLVVAALPVEAQQQRFRDTLPWPTGTFSILAYDSASGEIGGAVQSRVFAVGNGVLWAEAGLGVVATQAIVDVSYGPQALALLRRGLSAEQVVRQVRITVIHEVGHHFGIDDARLHELGWA